MPDPRVDEVRRDLAEFRQAVTEQFAQMEHGHDETHRQLDTLNGTVGRIKAELGPGLPDEDERGDRPTIRDRLHRVENDRELIEQLAGGLTQQLASVNAVVTDLKTERDKTRVEREAQEILRREQEKRWSRRRILLVTACAVVGALCAVLGALFAALQLISAT